MRPDILERLPSETPGVDRPGNMDAPASTDRSALDALPAGDVDRRVHDPRPLATMTPMAPLPYGQREAFAKPWHAAKARHAG